MNLLVCALVSIPMAGTLYGIGEEIYRCEIQGLRTAISRPSDSAAM